MSHSDSCQTTEKEFVGVLGSAEVTGPDEYKITVTKDVVELSDGSMRTYYFADMLVGRRWADHLPISFGDVGEGTKEHLLYGMRQMREDLNDAIKYLEEL